MRLAVLAVLVAGPAFAEVPRVVTDFGPVQSLVADVMGDLGAPVALLPKGGDPHDFQLRPSQAKALAAADLVVWIGPELMPALGEAIVSVAPQAVAVPLLHATPTRPFDEGGVDPHAWLDPANAAGWLGTIADALAAKDPDNAPIYAANAEAANAALTQADEGWQALLTPLRTRPFVAYHDALGYFTAHFGLDMVGAIELSDATAPSAARLSQVQAVITEGRAVCVLPEAGRDPKFITLLSDGLPVKIGAPQDIEFLTLEPGRGQYVAMMDQLVRGMADCLAP